MNIFFEECWFHSANGFFFLQILTVKGKKEVHKLSSAERGSLITAVTCTSAAGQYIPPMLIFPRKNRKNELGDGAPPDSLIEYSESGWITTHHFTKWFAHFLKFGNPTNDDPVVLVFDGHYTHTRNIDIINLARENHVSLVCLPPHTSNKTQPLDVSFMKPFKSYYSSAIESWMDTHEGRVVTHYQIASLFCTAYEQAATMGVARNEFAITGIMPYNRNIFPQFMFVTAKDVNEGNSSVSSSSQSSALHFTPSTSYPREVPQHITPQAILPLPTSEPEQMHISPADIRPILCVPDAPPSTRRGEAKVISASPYKNAILLAIKRKEEKEAKKALKNGALSNPPAENVIKEVKKRGRPKKEIAGKQSNTKATNSASTKAQNVSTKKPRAQRKLNLVSSSSSSSESESEIMYASSTESEDDAACQFCNKTFKTDSGGEKWICCCKCFAWCHEVCDAAAEECSSKRKYVCSACLNS